MNKKVTYILGTHSGHDASACLIANGTIVNAIAKERLTRKKHDSGEPIECVDYLLDAAQLKKEDIDLVVRTNWFDSTELNDAYYESFPHVIVSQKHHEFHAWSALTVLPKTPSLIVVLDGRGCRRADDEQLNESSTLNDLQQFEVESVYLYDGKGMQVLEKRYATYYKNKYKWGSHIDSLGYAYAAVSKTIFHSSNAAGKIMALAALGSPNERIPQPFLFDEEHFTVNEAWLQFIHELELPLEWDTALAKDLAYSVQHGLEQYLLFRIPQLISAYGISTICLSGGVALNCKVNGLLAQLNSIEQIAVFNACGDDGLSIGAAIWGKENYFADKEPIKWTSSLGKNYFNEAVADEILKQTAAYLVDGKLIGLYSGGSEYGPRALGHRSILASPLNVTITRKLNLEIKQRELFRPFGCAVLQSDLALVTSDHLASNNMLSAVHLKEEWKQKYPALLHVDGTTRLQVLEDENSHFSKVIKIFKELTGCPLLINTSFNGKEEPIVETPEQALATARNIQLDYVLLQNQLISTS